MGDDNGAGIIFGIGFVSGGLLVLAICMGIGRAGHEVTVSNWQKACVEHNAAHWETASDGSTTFVWNEEGSE